jgi:hypothetical protein
VILQVVVNLVFHPSKYLADVCVIVSIFSSGTLNQDGWQDSCADDGNTAN